MRVLLTGCNGYIGCVLAPLLLARGHAVVGLDTNYYRKSLFSGRLPEIETLSRDIRDIAPSDVAGFDAIIHLAGLSNDPLGDYRPQLTEQINGVAAVALARLAREAGVQRFLFASSCSNYGAAGNKFLDENAPLNPVTPYGVSKVMVEAELQRLVDADFSPTYLRVSTAYGASPLLRFDLVINNLTAWAFTTGRIYLKSDGSAWRPVVHVEDIAQAYIAALEAPREAVHDRAFNVGTSTENYRVRELASNDGYLLKNYLERGVPVLGIDPADGPAREAEKIGVRTLNEFFTVELAAGLAARDTRADVIHANNVLAHVVDINGFVQGIAMLLKDTGIAVIEVPYVKELIDHCEFDTIYHEHLCYFSVTALDTLFRRHRLYINEVHHLEIHGGSLRLYVEKNDRQAQAVQSLLTLESREWVYNMGYYRDFAHRVKRVKTGLVGLLRALQGQGKRIAGYGAAAKGTTLINSVGIGTELLDFVVDRSRHKQGRYMPGLRFHFQRLRGAEPVHRVRWTISYPRGARDQHFRQPQAVAAGSRY